MTPTQLRTILDRLQLSQLGAAKLLGRPPRTIRRWVADTDPTPEAAILFRLLADGRLSQDDVASARIHSSRPLLRINSAELR